MVSSFHLTRSARLRLAHLMNTDERGLKITNQASCLDSFRLCRLRRIARSRRRPDRMETISFSLSRICKRVLRGNWNRSRSVENPWKAIWRATPPTARSSFICLRAMTASRSPLPCCLYAARLWAARPAMGRLRQCSGPREGLSRGHDERDDPGQPRCLLSTQRQLYSNSKTTGDWETFIAVELVNYIDSHYRTIPDRASRGLTGHSMGGYGTFRIGMKHPEVFSSLYAMSACCMIDTAEVTPAMTQMEAIKTKETRSNCLSIRSHRWLGRRHGLRIRTIRPYSSISW
jgi:Putative esterase